MYTDDWSYRPRARVGGSSVDGLFNTHGVLSDTINRCMQHVTLRLHGKGKVTEIARIPMGFGGPPTRPPMVLSVDLDVDGVLSYPWPGSLLCGDQVAVYGTPGLRGALLGQEQKPALLDDGTWTLGGEVPLGAELEPALEVIRIPMPDRILSWVATEAGEILGFDFRDAPGDVDAITIAGLPLNVGNGPIYGPLLAPWFIEVQPITVGAQVRVTCADAEKPGVLYMYWRPL